MNMRGLFESSFQMSCPEIFFKYVTIVSCFKLNLVAIFLSTAIKEKQINCWELYFELILTNMKDEGLMETKEETCKERKRLQHIFYFISLFLVTLVSLLYKEIQGIGFNESSTMYYTENV
jgi:hypothetical protein